MHDAPTTTSTAGGRARRDAYGLPITVSSPRALELYDAGVRELLAWGAGAQALFEQAVDVEPDFALARAMVAVCLFLAEDVPEGRARFADALRDADRLTPRERRHLGALGLWIEGRTAEAEAALQAALDEDPADLILLQRLFFIHFWQGRSDAMLATTTRSLPHLGEDSFIRGLHSFALEETGQYAAALRHGRAALALNGRDAWAVHAVAHIYYEQGDNASGSGFMPPALARCDHLGYFRTHLTWHLALFELAAGRDARVWALYREQIRARRSTFRAELDDAIGLLWRLGLFGHETAELWGELAEIARARIQAPNLVYHEMILGMALAAAGDWDALGRHVAGLRARAAATGSAAIGEVGVPLLEGLGAFARGDYAATARAIGPIRARIVVVGGSHAQREVFGDTLLEAYLRLGDRERAEALLLERLEHRPSMARGWLRLGRVRHAAGRPDEARAAIDRALRLWADADADAPEVREARALAAKGERATGGGRQD